MEVTVPSDILRINKKSPQYWVVTFNDPPMNLLTPEMYEKLWSLLNDLEADPDVQVVVFDSSAADYYIMHIDMVNGSKALRQPGKDWGLFIQRLNNMPVVSIAVIRGRVRGIGSEFVLSCDMRFASLEKAILGQPEVAAGVIPGGSGLDWLPRLAGRSRALEICVGGEDFDSKTAELYGYINRAIPDIQLDSFVDGLAQRIARFPKYSVAHTKAVINNRTNLPEPGAIRETQGIFMQCVAMPETQSLIKKLFAAGLQQDCDFELNLGRTIAQFEKE